MPPKTDDKKEVSELEVLKAFVHNEIADTATHAALIRLIDHVASIKGKA